jgi:hypothetical protein
LFQAGHVNSSSLDQLIWKLKEGTLTNAEVFDHHGHGALVENKHALDVEFITVLGPRRGMMETSEFETHFAVPYGDMMITGCFGLVHAWGDIFPNHKQEVYDCLTSVRMAAPWESL